MSSPGGAVNQTGYVTGSAPTIVPAAALGSTATAVVSGGSMDQKGVLTLSSAGTGQAVNSILATVTFGKAVVDPGIAPTIVLTPLTGPSASLDAYVANVTDTGFQIGGGSIAVAATSYTYAYSVIY